ncbi:hypothetical protein GCM10010343_11910 [Streptomyces avidinii]|nr:hypothetical protein GCM10010343_11910 [Streptomyces avidinii]
MCDDGAPAEAVATALGTTRSKALVLLLSAQDRQRCAPQRGQFGRVPDASYEAGCVPVRVRAAAGRWIAAQCDGVFRGPDRRGVA